MARGVLVGDGPTGDGVIAGHGNVTKITVEQIAGNQPPLTFQPRSYFPSSSVFLFRLKRPAHFPQSVTPFPVR